MGPMAHAADGWEATRFGRPSPGKLNWSLKPAVVTAFKPSGVGCRILRCGEYTLLYNHGLYWSDQEKPDDSHDMQASVVLFNGNQRLFVARGYKFSGFKYDVVKKTINLSHWTGVMGDKQIEELTLDVSGDRVRCTTRFFSTKGKQQDLHLFAKID